MADQTYKTFDIALGKPGTQYAAKASVCAGCGAIVFDQHTHDEFHEKLEVKARRTKVRTEVHGEGEAGPDHTGP